MKPLKDEMQTSKEAGKLTVYYFRCFEKRDLRCASIDMIWLHSIANKGAIKLVFMIWLSAMNVIDRIANVYLSWY